MLILALFLACVVARAPKHPEVFATFTNFGPGDQRTIVHSARVNTTDGAIIQQATLFNYLGSSGTVDGISAFDQEGGTIYYANDFANSYIWGVDVRYPYALKAPIFLEDNGVAQISFDWKDRQLLVSDVVQNTGQFRLVVYPLNPALSTRTFIFPSNVAPGNGAYDPEKGLFFNVASSSATWSNLTALNINTGAVARSLTVQCGYINKLWVERSHPDFTSRLWGVRANFSNNDLTYDMININLQTGACQTLRIPSAGIVTAFAFDDRNGVLFYHDASNQGNFLRTASVRDGKNTQLLLQTQFALSDLAVRFVE